MPLLPTKATYLPELFPESALMNSIVAYRWPQPMVINSNGLPLFLMRSISSKDISGLKHRR